MPYIEQTRRFYVQDHPDSSGELNFAITNLLHIYLQRHGKKYATLNDCLGALEGAKLEFFRRVVAPYEDKKIEENGDLPYTENLVV